MARVDDYDEIKQYILNAIQGNRDEIITQLDAVGWDLFINKLPQFKFMLNLYASPLSALNHFIYMLWQDYEGGKEKSVKKYRIISEDDLNLLKPEGYYRRFLENLAKIGYSEKAWRKTEDQYRELFGRKCYRNYDSFRNSSMTHNIRKSKQMTCK